jgi:DNA-binding response OmpR family regulator
MATILLIENDDILLGMLAYNLMQAGFQVLCATDGIAGLEMARHTQPDLIVLDVMLPGLDGFSICRIIANDAAIPIVLLTALRDEAHRIAGLDLGAVDCMVKPFSMAELLARVRTILRWNERHRQTTASNIIHSGPIRLDRNSRRVWFADREISLTHREFDLLTCLMHNTGTALSRDLLLERVWGDDFDGSNRTIDVHVCWLREKLEPDPANPVFIRTVRGIGYCFQAPSTAPIAREPAWA